jgi:hypothetical protein
MDTDMTQQFDVPKSNPADTAKLAIDAIEAGHADSSRAMFGTPPTGEPGEPAMAS